MAKRGNSEGSIYKREDGRWVGQLNLGYVNGKRTRKYFYGPTRKEVQGKLTRALSEQQSGSLVVTERQTVETFLRSWLADAVGPTKAPKTFESYAEIVRVHIIPTLGRYQLTKLTPQHVQALIQQKTDEGLSPRTVGYIRSVLRIALNRALKWGLVGRNVAALVDVPRQQRYEAKPLTPNEVRQFLDAARGDRLEALYTAALALGLRLGEGLGLHWRDVDLDNRTLRVRTTLQRVGGKLILKEPKTARSRRVIDLPEVTVHALRAHRVRQLEERLAAGSAWHDSDLIFTSSIGTPMEPANATQRFRRVLMRAGIPPRRFHDLRHSCASLLMAQGVPVRMIMEILGHAQMSTTMDLYAHVMPAARREAADLMNDILSPG